MSTLADIGKSLLNVAPTIAGAILGPAGGVVTSGAVYALKKVLGIKEDASTDELQAALTAMTPEQYVALRQADNEFKQHLIDAGVDLERIDASDRASARGIYDSSKTMTNILAALIVIGWMVLNYFIFTSTIELVNKDLVLRTLGTLDMAVGGVIYFFFGSSRGSEKLKDIISNTSSFTGGQK